MPGNPVRAFLLLAIACGLFPAGCRQDQRKTVKVMGSTSIQPFAEELGREFETRRPDRKVQVEGGGSTAGIQALADGLADIGMCSRNLRPEEASRFTPLLIARDGLAIIVHPSNPVDDLSLEQLRQVFAGNITNWKEVGGQDAPVGWSRERKLRNPRSLHAPGDGQDASPAGAWFRPPTGGIAAVVGAIRRRSATCRSGRSATR